MPAHWKVLHAMKGSPDLPSSPKLYPLCPLFPLAASALACSSFPLFSSQVLNTIPASSSLLSPAKPPVPQPAPLYPLPSSPLGPCGPSTLGWQRTLCCPGVQHRHGAAANVERGNLKPAWGKVAALPSPVLAPLLTQTVGIWGVSP